MSEATTETARIADQLRRAFEGEAWHGDSLFQILDGISAEQAVSRPIKSAHSIWELVLHISTWDNVCRRRLLGEALEPPAEENFPVVADSSKAAWRHALEHAKHQHNELVKVVEAFPDSRLGDKVPGKEDEPAYHTFYYMLHGLVQHELYHAGQISMLKKLV